MANFIIGFSQNINNIINIINIFSN